MGYKASCNDPLLKIHRYSLNILMLLQQRAAFQNRNNIEGYFDKKKLPLWFSHKCVQKAIISPNSYSFYSILE